MNSTIEYYNKNAREYCEKTYIIPMKTLYDRFEIYLKPGGRLLNLGCGSGRDSIYFLSKGFDVVSVDGSIEICKVAESNIGKQVRNIQFEELDYHNEFDAIWANASLLHIRREKLELIIEKILMSLRKNGVLYASWKCGDTDRVDEGKHYTDMTENKVIDLFNKFDVEVLEIWGSDDQLQRGNKWINIITKKN